MVGRPPKFNAERAAQIVATVRDGGTIEDAATCAGVSPALVYSWVSRGKTGKAGAVDRPFLEFLEALTRARAERRVNLEARLFKFGQTDWRALLAYMQIVDPSRYAPRVRVYVEQELSDALKRLKSALAPFPEALELALAALAGEAGANGVAPPPEWPGGGGFNSDSSELYVVRQAAAGG